MNRIAPASSVSGILSGAVLLGAAFWSLHAAAPAVAQERVRVWEGELTLPTYALLPDDPNPRYRETDDSIVYPYTMQDNLGSERAPKTYRAFFLENEYLKLACLPEIGGRIQWVLDKRRNEQMFYDNRVVRPGLIALRGAWVSGGIEWNRGPQGHTVTSFSPVNVTGVENPDGSATLVIGEVEQSFRTGWDARVTLRPGVARLDEEIRLFNPTDLPHPYYFWNNTAFPNRPGTRFIYPMSLATDHFGTTYYRWPENDGIDMTRLPNYPEPTSIFAYRAVHDFFGAYDSDRDFGIVQTADHRMLPGKKGWTWGQGDDGAMNQRALTDEDGPYIEVQSGPLPTQSDYAWLRPGRTVAWEEQWAPVFGLGEGFEFATPEVVVARGRDGFRFLSTTMLDGAEIMLSGGEPVRADLTPLEVVEVPWSGGADAPVRVTVRRLGTAVLDYESPLRVPIEQPPGDSADEPPDEPMDGAAGGPRPDDAEALPEPTASALFREGEVADKALDRVGAREAYRRALALDPGHSGARAGLGVLDLKAGLHARAGERLAAAAADDPEDGFLRFLLGVARYRAGDFEGALDDAHRAARLSGVEAVAWRLAGRARMRLGEPEKAASAFGRAAALGDVPASEEMEAMALHASGRSDRAAEWARARISSGTVRLAPWALVLLTGEDESVRSSAAAAMVRLAGETEFAITEALLVLADLGLGAEALELLDALRRHGGFEPGPMLRLRAADWAAHWTAAWTPHRSEAGDRLAGSLAAEALAAPLEYVFPSRPESLPVLVEAARAFPDEAAPHALLGRLLAGLGRYPEASAAWSAAVAIDPTLSTAHRALAAIAWRLEDRPAIAENRFRAAIGARPEDQTLHRDLARLLLERGRPAAAAEVLESLPAGARKRHDVIVEHARALLATARLDEAVDMLSRVRVNFREGDATVWRLHSRIRVERGRRLLDAGDAGGALAEFEAALTYPENLGVGRPARPYEARARFFLAAALEALGRSPAAVLGECAGAHPHDDEQELFAGRCAARLNREPGF